MGNQEQTEVIQEEMNSIYEWSVEQHINKLPFNIQGDFYCQYKNSNHELIHFFANDEFIYFFDHGHIKCLSFFLTIMEEKFYYDNTKYIYALKLVSSNKRETVLSTTDRENFVTFYCHLAKFCVLTHFDRHFLIKEQLGKGSYGTVYRGLNKLSYEEVALKVFHKKHIHHSQSNKRVIQNQIYILEKLRKCNLSPLLEIFDTDDCIILVLELAKCGDLLQYLLNEEVEINETLMRHALEQILQNLSALHKAGFIHRDIKPDNIVVKKGSDNIKLFLCDFSISLKQNDSKCEFMKSMKAGTPGFVAPQILKDNIFNEKCDLFSFGCLVYLLFTGQKLFQHIPDYEISILLEDNEFIQQKIQYMSASKSLKKLLRKLLQVDPEMRISAEEALRQEYFSQSEKQVPFIVECDSTFKQFIEKRINLYSASTKGETFF